MNNHKHHNILGRYCWTCQLKTEAGLPGWPKSSISGGVRRSPWGGAVYDKSGAQIGYFGATEAIIWANGDSCRSRDQRVCAIDATYCPNPVELEFMTCCDPYRSVNSSSIKS